MGERATPAALWAAGFAPSSAAALLLWVARRRYRQLVQTLGADLRRLHAAMQLICIAVDLLGALVQFRDLLDQICGGGHRSLAATLRTHFLAGHCDLSGRWMHLCHGLSMGCYPRHNAPRGWLASQPGVAGQRPQRIYG